MSRRTIFAVLTALAAIALIRADIAGAREQVYLFKPLATILILSSVLVAAPRPSAAYRTLIAAGLALSLVGDVLLMLPANLFAAGLGAFLVAHLCYISAFATHGGGPSSSRVALLPFAAIAAAILLYLWPALGALRIPVVLYIGVITSMAWQGWARFLRVRTPGSARAAWGALFFLASDGVLAVNKFRGPLGDRATVTIAILGTYLVAQWLIASSVGDERAA
jgi:uncharacterized membrane protein YhhN